MADDPIAASAGPAPAASAAMVSLFIAQSLFNPSPRSDGERVNEDECAY
jgi:hypothetical protein